MSGQASSANGPSVDRLAEMLDELLTSTPGAGSSFHVHYQLLFSVAYPLREQWPVALAPSSELCAELSLWISTAHRQLDSPREQRTFMSRELFADLMHSLPAKLDMDSWVSDVVAQHAEIRTAVDLNRMLLHITQSIADEMACRVVEIYDVTMRARGQVSLLGLVEMQSAAREMLGDEFFQLPFDTVGLLAATNRLGQQQFLALRDFNTVLTELDREVLAAAGGSDDDADEMKCD
ncbi:hypothetical protein MBLNU459_g2625t2 [Dothideomycetes sp. NU459]